MATINDFMELDIRVGEIIQVKTFIKGKDRASPSDTKISFIINDLKYLDYIVQIFFFVILLSHFHVILSTSTDRHSIG
ncbi:hypothetical protein [Pelosinus propionicus]|uniref:tRNA-binding protein n=1 Tax=Pelosinus propionicus DSM 13327 TaxID=1123291 RepID=A0A1I4H149_9FIRM|nr:hypothetical protein [Pelosinus propionicus]SFL35949.1 hypothetical protein SAMN04490355_1002100 [Pelosinus propionicus DSM 13327]